MTYKQIEATREVRLWITQIVVPITTTVIAASICVPEVRQAIAVKCKSIKNSINKKFKKKREKVIRERGLDENLFWIHNTETGEYRIVRLRF